jgi:hypothetical protein
VAPRALLLVLLTTAGLVVAAEPVGTQPRETPSRVSRATEPAGRALRVSTVNRRYFTDSTGRAVYLTGSHVWWNLVGDRTWRSNCELGSVRPFDYDDYLDHLVDTTTTSSGSGRSS